MSKKTASPREWAAEHMPTYQFVVRDIERGDILALQAAGFRFAARYNRSGSTALVEPEFRTYCRLPVGSYTGRRECKAGELARALDAGRRPRMANVGFAKWRPIKQDGHLVLGCTRMSPKQAERVLRAAVAGIHSDFVLADGAACTKEGRILAGGHSVPLQDVLPLARWFLGAAKVREILQRNKKKP